MRRTHSHLVHPSKCLRIGASVPFGIETKFVRTGRERGSWPDATRRSRQKGCHQNEK